MFSHISSAFPGSLDPLRARLTHWLIAVGWLMHNRFASHSFVIRMRHLRRGGLSEGLTFATAPAPPLYPTISVRTDLNRYHRAYIQASRTLGLSATGVNSLTKPGATPVNCQRFAPATTGSSAVCP